MGLFTRSIRPPDDVTPNPNDPASVPPSSVGPDQLVRPGDPSGLTLEGESPPNGPLPTIWPSPWSGWPADWWPPPFNSGHLGVLSDTAWMCLDLNSSLLATMPPYLVRESAAQSTPDAGWLQNPDPDVYASWEEFAKSLFWDYQLGEVFVLQTASYATGWPARFHVVPPWAVQVELRDGLRRYTIGGEDVTGELLHVRYQSSVSDAHGHGPLEAGRSRLVAASILVRYGTEMATQGGIPSSILKSDNELGPDGAAKLQQQWVNARLSKLGMPAVLEGGLTWEATQMTPRDMALLDLLEVNERHIAALLGVPPEVIGLRMTGDSRTYANITSLFDLHWRAGLRPKASAVMAALSGWALPRGTRVEVNRDAYIEPEPLQRAQTAQILNGIVDKMGNPAMTVAEIRSAERLDNSVPEDISSGVLK